MERKIVVKLRSTPGGVFVPCPVCRTGHILRLRPDTSAAGLVIYCRSCKQESVIDFQAGEQENRVTLHPRE